MKNDFTRDEQSLLLPLISSTVSTDKQTGRQTSRQRVGEPPSDECVGEIEMSSGSSVHQLTLRHCVRHISVTRSLSHLLLLTHSHCENVRLVETVALGFLVNWFEPRPCCCCRRLARGELSLYTLCMCLLKEYFTSRHPNPIQQSLRTNRPRRRIHRSTISIHRVYRIKRLQRCLGLCTDAI